MTSPVTPEGRMRIAKMIHGALMAGVALFLLVTGWVHRVTPPAPVPVMVDDQPVPAHRALGGSGKWVPREWGALVHQPRPRLAGGCRRRSGHPARTSTESVPGELEPYELAVFDHGSGFVMMYRRARYSSPSVRTMRS